MVSTDGLNWRLNKNCLGPFPHKGKPIQIFSVIVDKQDKIFIAVTTEEKTVKVFSSTDRGVTFEELGSLKADQTVVFPRISLSAKGELLLFISFLWGEDLGIYQSRSPNGKLWSPLTIFLADEKDLSQKSLPYHSTFKGKDYLAFQAKQAGSDFQIYLCLSTDGTKTWSKPLIMTDFPQRIGDNLIIASRMANQRPFLQAVGPNFFLTWERNSLGRAPQVFVLNLDENGKILSEPQRISEGTANCYNPQIFALGNTPYLIWFDDSIGGQDNVHLTRFMAGSWTTPQRLSRGLGHSRFPRPLVLNDRLFIFWENELNNVNRLILLKPDIYVEAPVLKPLNFNNNGYGKLDVLKISWEVPQDSSGIEGILYALHKAPTVKISETRQVLVNITQIDLAVPEDGNWHISVFAKDYAGNISKASQLLYTRDTTPPAKVIFSGPFKDEEGYLESNSAIITWLPPSGEKLKGYLAKLTSAPSGYETAAILQLKKTQALDNFLNEPEFKLNNLDNGNWFLAVSAVDLAGNIGEPEIFNFKLKNYKPVTYLTGLEIQDVVGSAEKILKVFGRGFTEGGEINEVIIDSDGKEPFEYVFKIENNDFKIETDRVVSGIKLKDLAEGKYLILVRHPVRGLAQNPKVSFSIDLQGVVKYGPFIWDAENVIKNLQIAKYKFSLTEILVLLVVVFAAFLLFIFLFKLKGLVQEAVGLKHEVALFFQRGGDLAMQLKGEKIAQLKKKGIGLRLKFSLLISVLVVLIVIMVALPISIFMIQNQVKTLASKLAEKVEIVLKGVSEQARIYLFEKNTLALSEILQKQYALLGPDARFAYITGPIFINPKTGSLDLTASGEIDDSSLEHIWAYFDPNLLQKIETKTFEPILSKLKDEVSPLLTNLRTEIDKKGKEELYSLNKRIDEINDEYNIYILRTDAKALEIKERLRKELQTLNRQRESILERLGSLTATLPYFDYQNPNLEVEEYTFYCPIVNRLRSHPDKYFWGTVRIGISTLGIREEIRQSIEMLIIETAIIALIALGLGFIGAWIMALITINPIRLLAKGVVIIRDTADKEKLKDHYIDIRSKDEIGMLAETVNQMTQGLVKAAIANKEMIIGKEVQKMFIPLELDSVGKKKTTGFLANSGVEIFGYYEGAKGVSGDYFDFKQLDERHFAIIKCDVAGKGVPAALIMVEVATIFLTYFREPSLQKEGRQLEKLVYRINDMLEERGFRGRFAALNVCLFDSVTGLCSFCNAGDNLIHIYRKKKEAFETISLINSPAAGVFPSSLVELQNGFKTQNYQLEPGDTLFLFTDGVDESKRFLRDNDFKVTVCREEGLADGETHGNTHKKGSETEDFGIERFKGIVEAVYKRTSYQLKKYHDPLPPTQFGFNFSNCQDKIEEVVLAVIAAEKLFRLVPDPQAGNEDIVKIDKKIEAFLKEHWSFFTSYFKNSYDNSDEPNYSFYSNLKEDEQYDDLTIVAVRKK